MNLPFYRMKFQSDMFCYSVQKISPSFLSSSTRQDLSIDTKHHSTTRTWGKKRDMRFWAILVRLICDLYLKKSGNPDHLYLNNHSFLPNSSLIYILIYFIMVVIRRDGIFVLLHCQQLFQMSFIEVFVS